MDIATKALYASCRGCVYVHDIVRCGTTDIKLIVVSTLSGGLDWPLGEKITIREESFCSSFKPVTYHTIEHKDVKVSAPCGLDPDIDVETLSFRSPVLDINERLRVEWRYNKLHDAYTVAVIRIDGVGYQVTRPKDLPVSSLTRKGDGIISRFLAEMEQYGFKTLKQTILTLIAFHESEDYSFTGPERLVLRNLSKLGYFTVEFKGKYQRDVVLTPNEKLKTVLSNLELSIGQAIKVLKLLKDDYKLSGIGATKRVVEITEGVTVTSTYKVGLNPYALAVSEGYLKIEQNYQGLHIVGLGIFGLNLRDDLNRLKEDHLRKR